MKNIYVGNLDVTTTEHQLRELFGAYGAVASVTLVIDRDTKIPRGFAFIEMNDNAAAEAAIKALHGTTFGGRLLALNEARPKQLAVRTDASERREQTREPLATRKHRDHRY